MSLPSRECGLKSHLCLSTMLHSSVTPLAGVWIEICTRLRPLGYSEVTPLAGVWIEIRSGRRSPGRHESLPSRECGLKFCKTGMWVVKRGVTPLAGVWIEINGTTQTARDLRESHSPRGSVD